MYIHMHGLLTKNSSCRASSLSLYICIYVYISNMCIHMHGLLTLHVE